MSTEACVFAGGQADALPLSAGDYAYKLPGGESQQEEACAAVDPLHGANSPAVTDTGHAEHMVAQADAAGHSQNYSYPNEIAPGTVNFTSLIIKEVQTSFTPTKAFIFFLTNSAKLFKSRAITVN